MILSTIIRHEFHMKVYNLIDMIPLLKTRACSKPAIGAVDFGKNIYILVTNPTTETGNWLIQFNYT